MKAYTDLEQSKKLAEILPIESADMCYIQDLLAYCKYGEYRPYIGNIIPAYGQDKIKCWSLAALIGVIPHNLKLVLAINDYQGDRKEKYVIGSIEHDNYDCFADNPIDACYELILKLNELNLL